MWLSFRVWMSGDRVSRTLHEPPSKKNHRNYFHKEKSFEGYGIRRLRNCSEPINQRHPNPKRSSSGENKSVAYFRDLLRLAPNVSLPKRNKRNSLHWPIATLQRSGLLTQSSSKSS